MKRGYIGEFEVTDHHRAGKIVNFIGRLNIWNEQWLKALEKWLLLSYYTTKLSQLLGRLTQEDHLTQELKASLDYIPRLCLK
jgi:hypothetical protein